MFTKCNPPLLLLGLTTCLQAKTVPPAEMYWPQWRGPLATGEAPHADPPIHWSASTNLRWTVDLPGEGHSTPVVWSNRIFVTAAVPTGEPFEPKPDTAPGAHDNRLVTHRYDFCLFCIDRQTGRLLWKRKLRNERPKEGGHFTGSLASNSPLTDGERVIAFFGSRGLYATDFEGTLLWQKDFGKMETRHAHGEGSSPALANGLLVVNWDHEFESFVAAVDVKTGKEKWRQPRKEKTSWSSPLIVKADGRKQIVIAATERIRGYDLQTGEVIWQCAGLSRNVVSTPVASTNGLVFVSNSYDWRIIMAIRLAGARGDISNSDQVVWTTRNNTSYVASPLLIDDTLYWLSHLSAILTSAEAQTGITRHGPFRLTGLHRVFASPVAAAGRIYIADTSGSVLVLKHGKEKLKILAHNELNDRFSASPVAVGRQLILRGHDKLYCIE